MMYPIFDEKLRFHRYHLFAGNIVEIVRIDTSSQVFVVFPTSAQAEYLGFDEKYNLYTGYFIQQFQPLHRRNFHAEFKPLHRLNEVFEKWWRVSSTDGFCSRSKL
ncbi:hypothetical protein TNCV_4395271 [Trichonephila clavipes]|uniref:Uncharacterized protein n=1 Tax=Trichonephila clavipes TaxID=2585209 RepID=A0A8X6W4K8_TRICX|nr:hypothetical protein TNCV_4395271 [Trichonephila clavipes]